MRCSVFALLCTATVCAAGQAPEASAEATLRVMSFNIRYGTAGDGENRWENRKELVLKTIRAFDPDILGTQEVLAFQARFLREKLPEYGFAGVGRDDGKAAGEFAAVFFKKSRFEKVGEEHFWLSTTPEVPGSKSWDSSITRVTSHVTLRLRDGSHGVVHHFNTHFDHRGATARLESARLMRDRIDKLGAGATVVVTGDFNAGAGSEPYKALVGKAAPGAPTLLDTYRVRHAAGGEEGTFHGFRGTAGHARIDWILCSGQLGVIAAGIDRTNEDGRYPSDHFPVTAVVRL